MQRGCGLLLRWDAFLLDTIESIPPKRIFSSFRLNGLFRHHRPLQDCHLSRSPFVEHHDSTPCRQLRRANATNLKFFDHPNTQDLPDFKKRYQVIRPLGYPLPHHPGFFKQRSIQSCRVLAGRTRVSILTVSP